MKDPSPELSQQQQRDLVEAIVRAADRQAFALLFRYFAPRLKSFFMRAGIRANTAEELAQETMLRVWGKAAAFDTGKACVSTWIYTIARNQRIDHLRSQASRQSREEAPGEWAVQPPSAEEVLLLQERDVKVRRALLALPSEQADVIRLSYFSDKPHAEIASELGIPIGTVKSRLRYAVTRLRNCMSEPE